MTKGELKKLLNESSDDDSAEVYIASGATNLTENYYYILDAKKNRITYRPKRYCSISIF